MQQAASVEAVCARTKDTLFLCKQDPSSTDLFMCQVDGGDTFFSLFIELMEPHFEGGVSLQYYNIV